MSYTIEEVGKCSRKIIFNFEKIDLDSIIINKLKEKQKKVDFKGFRRGKVPLDIVKKFYGPEAENEAINQFISESFWNTLDKEKMEIIGQPVFDKIKYEGNGAAGGFEVMFDIMPTVDVGDLRALTFKRPKVQISEKDIETVKKQYTDYRSSLKLLEESTAALTKEHYATITLTASNKQGETIESLSKEKFLVKVGNDYLTASISVTDLASKLEGMVVGDKREIHWTAPADFKEDSGKVAAGEELNLTLELNEIKYLQRPDFTEEFVKEMGHESLAAFEKDVTEKLSEYKQKAIDENVQHQILEQLLATIHFDTPPSMIAVQEEQIKTDTKNKLKQQGMDEAAIEEHMQKNEEHLKKDAETSVRAFILLEHLSRKFQIQITNEDIKERYQMMAIQMQSQGMNITEETIANHYAKNKSDRRIILQEVHSLKVLRHLLTVVTLEEVAATEETSAATADA
ncbi:MAG: trigger factor [Oligoflexia bacterium]|nr:trigger factor [Oligoflexia bacterium]MBF0366212.1 trigger factor [Oligoflexia bacterium]